MRRLSTALLLAAAFAAPVYAQLVPPTNTPTTLAATPVAAPTGPERATADKVRNNAAVAGIAIRIAEGQKALVPKMKEWAHSGNARAQSSLAFMYQLGQGVPKDKIQALTWHLKAAAQGEVGSEAALAEIYQFGNGVPENRATAAKWRRIAADHGDAHSQLMMGVFSRNGYGGVEKDLAKSFEWTNKAAEQGDVDAQATLGLMHIAGMGTSQDIVQGMKWLTIAKANGDTKHIADLEHYESTETQEHIGRAQELASDWWLTHKRTRNP